MPSIANEAVPVELEPGVSEDSGALPSGATEHPLLFGGSGHVEVKPPRGVELQTTPLCGG